MHFITPHERNKHSLTHGSDWFSISSPHFTRFGFGHQWTLFCGTFSNIGKHLETLGKCVGKQRRESFQVLAELWHAFVFCRLPPKASTNIVKMQVGRLAFVSVLSVGRKWVVRDKASKKEKQNHKRGIEGARGLVDFCLKIFLEETCAIAHSDSSPYK